jgi:hypothetical protein
MGPGTRATQADLKPANSASPGRWSTAGQLELELDFHGDRLRRLELGGDSEGLEVFWKDS